MTDFENQSNNTSTEEQKVSKLAQDIFVQGDFDEMILFS